MTSSAEDRRGQLVLAILGAVANVLAVVGFVRSYVPVYVVGVLVLWVLLYIYGRDLLGFLRRHRRDLLFLVLGAALSAAGIEASRLLSADEPPIVAAPMPPAPLPPIETPTPIPETTPQAEIVYRTPSGERYHRADCRYAKGSGTPISLKEAKDSGLTPCRVCRPPK